MLTLRESFRNAFQCTTLNISIKNECCKINTLGYRFFQTKPVSSNNLSRLGIKTLKTNSIPFADFLVAGSVFLGSFTVGFAMSKKMSSLGSHLDKNPTGFLL